MNRPANSGFLLVLEGIDGVGKTTLSQRLARHCEERGLSVVQSREPTDGQWGRKLRESARTGRLALDEELRLFLADRAEHVEQVIRPALAGGKVVILDRYYLSTAAYQGARGADPGKRCSKRTNVSRRRPIWRCYLTWQPSAGLGRVRGRGDVPDEFERESALAEVRRIFLAIKRPWLVRIDAGREKESVATDCVAEFERAWAAGRPAA